jgi:hypothetical protein
VLNLLSQIIDIKYFFYDIYFRIRIRRMKYTTAFFMILFLIIGQQAHCRVLEESVVEKEAEWSFGANAGFSNKYLWRGMVFDNGLVFQPAVNVGWQGFSINFWGNTTLYDKDGVNAHEIDITLDYYHSFSYLDFETNFSYYNYIDQEGVPNTVELYIGAFYPVGDFTLSTGLNIDILENIGASYFEVAIDYERVLNEKVTVTGKALAGLGSGKFNENNLDVKKGAMNLVGGNIGLSYNVFEYFYIDANFYQNFFVDKDLKKSEVIMGKNSNAFELILRKEF